MEEDKKRFIKSFSEYVRTPEEIAKIDVADLEEQREHNSKEYTREENYK